MSGDWAAQVDEEVSQFLDNRGWEDYGVSDDGTSRYGGYYTFVMKGNLAMRLAILGCSVKTSRDCPKVNYNYVKSQKISGCILTKPEIGGHRPIITTKPAIGEGRNDRDAQMELAVS